MPEYVHTLPQSSKPAINVTIFDVIGALPEVLSYPILLDVWVGGQLARYGRTSKNIIFLVRQVDEPPPEMKLYFNELVKPLGASATVSECWLNNTIAAVKLYNAGRLIVDKKTFTYTELPSPVERCPVLTVTDVLDKLPETVPWTFPIYLTGGLVKNGFSNHDVDFIVFAEVQTSTLAEIRDYFVKLFSWRSDVGRHVMPDREPVYLYLLYNGGKLCRP